ncbi:MAG: hypothetical protein QOI31_2272 [Solirubrobacterales bacterium]|jgi:hypothetical protein|nr:hypothetical protein [Solirubrobacterales bacterium]
MGFARHIRANIVGYVALFVALSAGAYASALAPDSVKSKHIKDGAVRPDDVAKESLTGTEVAGNSLNGTDIAESTLGEVPNATIAGHGGYGRSSTNDVGSNCDPTGAAFVTCATVGLTPSASGRALVIGTIEGVINDGDDSGYGMCRLGVSTTGAIAGTKTGVYVDASTVSENSVTISGITDPLPAGNYTFGIDCNDPFGDAEFFEGGRITAVMISPF